MAKRKQQVQTHFDRMTVKLHPRHLDPIDRKIKSTNWNTLVQTDDIIAFGPTATFTVIATYIHVHDKDCQEMAFTLVAPDSSIMHKSASLWVVVDLDGEHHEPTITVTHSLLGKISMVHALLKVEEREMDLRGPDDPVSQAEQEAREERTKLEIEVFNDLVEHLRPPKDGGV